MTDKTRDEEARDPGSGRPAMERAEESVDRIARGAGYLASLVGLRILKGASLAREEAEDIWAEAQSMRRERQDAEPDMAVVEDTGGTIEATEAARRKARELNLDLREIQGTGAGGRITANDVKRKTKAEEL